MKIALLGYGKMGKTVEKVATYRKHEIVLKTNKNTTHFNIKNADVAIDFSTPDVAFSNISICLKNDVPVISGTTGWLANYNKIVAICKEKNGTFLYASNFSIGVNIFFEINKKLAQLMKNQPEYNVSIAEIHHTQKVDAPSGTAITLAEDIIKNTSKTSWKLDEQTKNDIPITAKRIENVKGTHTITYKSDIDTINIEHIAHSRDGFALGAVIAAEWILGKKGIFNMKDVLNI